MGRYIDPRPQYLSDDGDPLIEGKVFIFESGSATLKDIFFDTSREIPAPNPVILSASGRMPNTFFSGTAKATLTDSDEVQFWSIDPIESTSSGQGGFPDWNAITVWEIPNYVIGSDDNIYCSFINDNQDNNPLTTPTAWEEVEFTSIWNPNITYGITPRPDTVKASDGNFYKTIAGGNLGNDPISTAAWTAAVDITGTDLALTQATALSF